MNRPNFYRNLFPTLLVMLGLTPVVAHGQMGGQELSSAETRAVRAAVARPKAARILAVTMDFEGNFDSVDSAMAKFEREAKAQNLPNANPTGVLVLYEDPEGKSQFRMGVGVTLARKAEVKAPLQVGEFTFSAVRHTVVGPYQKLAPVGHTVMLALKQRPAAKKAAMAKIDANAPFAVLRLLSDPKKVKPAQLRTELIVPVRGQ